MLDDFRARAPALASGAALRAPAFASGAALRDSSWAKIVLDDFRGRASALGGVLGSCWATIVLDGFRPRALASALASGAALRASCWAKIVGDDFRGRASALGGVLGSCWAKIVGDDFRPRASALGALLALAVTLAGCKGSGSSIEPGVDRFELRPDVELGVYVADVGNGDATLVLGPPDRRGRRRSLLVDAGKLRADGGRIVRGLLETLDVGRLDYAVATHYDADHVGGYVTVLGSTSVFWESADCEPGPHFPRELIVDLGEADRGTRTYEEYSECVAATTGGRGEPEHHVVSGGGGLGRVLDLGGGYTATLVAGDGWVLGERAQVPYVNSANERSIAVLVSGPGGFDFLVTGDLIGRRFGSENALVEPVLGAALAGRGVDLEVLRVGHNGADNTSDPAFLDALRPEVALLSVSAQNNYGHPGCDTVDTLARLERVAQTQAGNSDCGAIEGALVADGHLAVWVTGDSYEVRSVGEVSPATGRPTRPFAFSCRVRGGCGEVGEPADRTPRRGEVIITEVMADPAARTDARGEWLELFAVGERPVDLEGCVLRDDDRDAWRVDGALPLRPGEALVLARDAPGFRADAVYGGALTLANGGDELVLECRGAIVDAVRWSDAPRGAALSLSGDAYSATANDRPAAWCEAAEAMRGGDRGSPGDVNPNCG